MHKPNLRVVLLGGYTSNSALIGGGVEAASMYLMKGLIKIDNLDLHVLTFRQDTWKGPNNYKQDGIEVHLLPPYPRFERLRSYRIYQSIINEALLKIKPMVLHAQAASSDAYVAIGSGFPTVVTAHGIRAEDAKYVHSWIRRLRFYFDSTQIERSIMQRVKYLIAISRYIPHYFSKLLRHDISLYYIPNAIDANFFDLGGNSNIPIVLYAGRVIPRKRVLDIVQAFTEVTRQVPQAELRIAGEITSEPTYVAQVRRLINSAGLADRVHLLGQLCQEDLLCEYRACSLVALPSSQETTPVVLAQAMAAGKPIVSTPVGGVVEMIGYHGERGVIVNIGDVDGLAMAIKNLLLDPVHRTILGQAGHDFALEHYHFERVAQRTFEVYQEIAESELSTIV